MIGYWKRSEGGGSQLLGAEDTRCYREGKGEAGGACDEDRGDEGTWMSGRGLRGRHGL